MSIKVQGLGSTGTASTALITISGSTNATPIVVTFAAGHGLKDFDRIAVAGITGNTNANGEWSLQFTGANTARLLGSVGNGTHGGTPRVAVINDVTPAMKGHSAELCTFGNLSAGAVTFEAYESYADFAAGVNTAGAVPPVQSPTGGVWTQAAGSGSAPASSAFTGAATNVGISCEVRLPRYMRAVLGASSTGTIGAVIKA